MEIYLVGGAVRDQLLGLPVKERDWVVVGATPAQMLALGYKPVGKDFPVFLHPQTKEEYALARTERKTGKGYTGFAFHAAPDVTLADDLRRRDLTINAIAQTETGEIIDPYDGQQDLKNKILRHVSPAFAEDPVRILRLARFAARFSEFQVHPDTWQLMRQMVTAGEVNALVAERVWQELSRALSERAPERFFQVLKECNALPILFPELTLTEQQLAALRTTTQLQTSANVRFAALFYSIAPESVLKLCDRYRVPKEFRDLALLISRYHTLYEQAETADAEKLVTTLEILDTFRRPERFQQFLQASVANYENSTALLRLKNAWPIAKSVTIEQLNAKELNGKEIADALHKLRVQKVHEQLKDSR